MQLEMKVQQGERDFEQVSKTIRKEVSRFEVSGRRRRVDVSVSVSVSVSEPLVLVPQKERVKDFKSIVIKYLESLVQTQQQVRPRVPSPRLCLYCPTEPSVGVSSSCS